MKTVGLTFGDTEETLKETPIEPEPNEPVPFEPDPQWIAPQVSPDPVTA